MALSSKTLQATLLGTTAYAAPYDVVSGKSAVVTALFLRNVDPTNAATVNVGVRISGAASGAAGFALLTPAVSLAANGGALQITEEITLAFPWGAGSGDRLEIWASGANVRLVVFGVERDI